MKILMLLFALGSGALSAAPFTNGSFELPGAAGSTFLSNGDTFVTGWTHAGNSLGEFYTASGEWSINAGDGTHYIGWGSNSATSGTMSQTFDTLIGTSYNVNYLLTTQQGGGTPPVQVALVEALAGSTILNSVTNSFNQGAGIWSNGLTLSFIASSTATTLRFTDQTTVPNSGPVNWGLDAVTVAGPVSSAVPEPATYALMGLGLGILSLYRKRF